MHQFALFLGRTFSRERRRAIGFLFALTAVFSAYGVTGWHAAAQDHHDTRSVVAAMADPSVPQSTPDSDLHQSAHMASAGWAKADAAVDPIAYQPVGATIWIRLPDAADHGSASDALLRPPRS